MVVLCIAALAAAVYADATPPPSGSFTIAVMPDTQMLAMSYPAVFDAQN